MYKKLLILLTFSLVAIGLMGQSVTGGAGVTHVSGDPDNITITQDVDVHESNICFDPASQTVYFFNPSGTSGVDQWEGVSVGSFANSDTRLTNPTVSGGNLIFEILNVVTNATTGATISIPILSIAPVQNVQGGGDVTVSSDANGVYTVSFTETNTSLSIAGSVITYTDEAGADTDITLPSATGAETKVNGGGDISVAGTGTTADPYVVSFSETNTSLSISGSTLTYTDEGGTANTVDLSALQHEAVTVNDGSTIDFTASGTDSQTLTAEITGSAAATNGQVPVSNGAGGITWSDANITSIAADANGKLVATLSSGATVVFDLDAAPRVASMSELDTAAAALSAGQTGIAVSESGNLLGMPAKETASVEIGVLFFIKKK